MSNHLLEYRRMNFRFDDAPVPFVWNPTNPGFSVHVNAISFLAVAWERYITAAVKDLVDEIVDEEVREEARIFLAQEAQHAAAHRKHVRALCEAYPTLEPVLDRASRRFDRLREERPARFHAAYMANIEATFPALFGLLIDHRGQLFGGGDERVASLMLWHFTEEIEHRSSAIDIYDAVVGSRWYRTRVMRASLKHMGGLFQGVLNDFRTHLPAEVVDCFAPEQHVHLGLVARQEIAARLRPRRRTVPAPRARTEYGCISNRRMAATLARVARSQTPLFRPERESLPAGYATWMKRFEAGMDMTRDFGRPTGSIADPVMAPR